jgi:hypothetical protein
MKKLVAMILCVSLLILSFPTSASAAGPHDINVLAGEGGKIALTEGGPPESGNIAVNDGSNVTLYIIPDSHYSIEDVMVDDVSQGAVTQYTFNNVSSPHSISATFARNTKTITVASVVNGEIRVNGMGESGSTVTVDEGSDVNIDVRPNAGYEIGSVTIGAITYSLDGEIGDRTGEFSRTVTANNNISVSAVFRYAQHTITTNVGPNGTVSPMNPKVNHGNDQTFTITPNPGYSIRSLTVDGNPASVDAHNQITLFNVQNDRMMSVDFAEVVNYTITTIAGPNGSITPGSLTVAQGADVTFTITPDPGYAIDELRVDGLHEMADEHNQLTVFNVQHSMTLEVSFIEVVAHTINIPKPANGNIQIVGEASAVPVEGSVITRNSKEIVSYFIIPDMNYGINSITLRDDKGEAIDVTFDFYYDEDAQKIRLDIETMFNYTLNFELIKYRPSGDQGYVILNSEIDTDDHIKAAARREFALAGYDVPTSKMTVSQNRELTSDNGIKYRIIRILIPDPVYEVYEVVFRTVEHYTDIFCVYDVQAHAGKDAFTKHIIYTGINPLAADAQIESPAMYTGWVRAYGPYAARIIGTINSEGYSVLVPYRNNLTHPLIYSVYEGPFYRAQVHYSNKGSHSNKEINLLPLTFISSDALCLNVQAISESGPQETFTWNLDKLPHVTLGDSTQEVFFGNDRVILAKPRDGIGDIASMTVSGANSPGYTFKNNPDGTITIDFLSDYYDKVTVPLTIVKQSGGTAKRNLTIHRVGVDIQAHNAADGNPSSTRTVFHGTQYGNLVNFKDGKKYKITASYFIPDFGDNRPYGLYVTRKYANGKTETQIITQPMSSPHPASADLFDPVKKVFIYNDGSSGWANVADYLIYSGPNAASAPVEISVLVLKNAPAAGDTFGGVNFGSGTGVKWTKP